MAEIALLPAADADYQAARAWYRGRSRFRPAEAQFGDALVTSAVVAFEKTPPPGGSRCATRATPVAGAPPA
jgi:hypothetical protein